MPAWDVWDIIAENKNKKKKTDTAGFIFLSAYMTEKESYVHTHTLTIS